MIAHVAQQKPIEQPGLREPSVTVHGVVVVRLCFDATGKPESICVVSGPALMQQPVLESMKDWTFVQVSRNGRSRGGCGLLRVRVDVTAGRVSSALE